MGVGVVLPLANDTGNINTYCVLFSPMVAPSSQGFIFWKAFHTATLKSGTLVKIPGPTYQIHGTKGSFIKYGLDVQEETLETGAIPNTPNWGMEPEAIWGTLKAEVEGIEMCSVIKSENGDYRDYFINLRDAIWGKAEIAVTAEQGTNVMKIIELAIQSDKEKRTIDVPQ